MTLLLTDPTLLKTQCYVNGQFVGKPDAPVHNPSTGAEIARVPSFGPTEATEAVDYAAAAFKPWAARVAKERSAILRKWFDLIIAHRDDLAMILTCEQGKPLAEAKGEIDYAAAYVEFYAEEAKRIAGETLPSHRADGRIIVLRQASGVVAAVASSSSGSGSCTRPATASAAGVMAKLISIGAVSRSSR